MDARAVERVEHPVERRQQADERHPEQRDDRSVGFEIPAAYRQSHERRHDHNYEQRLRDQPRRLSQHRQLHRGALGESSFDVVAVFE